LTPKFHFRFSSHDGGCELTEIPAGGRYNVVGVKTVEGAEPLVLVGTTYKLKAGESVTLDLSANDPWTRSKTP
jgi:hypothetical protein